MRNLEILTRAIDTLKSLQPNETITNFCLDQFSKILVIYTSHGRLLLYTYADTTTCQTELKSYLVLSDECPKASGAVVCMEYVQEISGVLLVYADGTMLQVKQQQVEEVGEIADGILAAAWAPNQEYLALATPSLMLLFTPEFDVLYEEPLDDGDLTFGPGDDKSSKAQDACISWRGDSQIFVCTYKINGGRKCLTRDMTQQMKVTKGPARADNQVVFSVAEKPLSQLELPTCIMPSGSLVTGFQKRVLPNQQLQSEIIFWERNGLRHGEFVLPAPAPGFCLSVKEITYNADSTLLAVLTENPTNSEHQILVYTRSNWKWYSKQVLVIGEAVASFQWLGKSTMFVVGQCGKLHVIEFNMVYHTSMSQNNTEVDTYGYTAVVDSCLIHLTPLGKQLMPPPMSEKQVTLASHVVCLSMFGNTVVAQDVESNLYVFDATQNSCEALMKLGFQLTQVKAFRDCLFGVKSGEKSDQICQINLRSKQINFTEDLGTKVQTLTLGSSLTYGKQFASDEHQASNQLYFQAGVNMLTTDFGNDNEDLPCIVFQSVDKSIQKLPLSNDQLQVPEPMFSLDYLAVQMHSCMVSGKPCVVTLTGNLRLYLNDKLLSNECTSFLVSQNFLLFTNTTSGIMHELHVYDLNRKLPADHTQLKQTTAEGDFNVRAVERGSRLVVCSQARLVMQMPRGNLEGIQPRIIMFKQIISLVEAKEYGKAFRLLRQHKIDINMLYDVDPAKFLANIDLFVAQVNQVDYLNLFVNSLKNDERGRELEFCRPQSEEDQVRRKHAELVQQFQITSDDKSDNSQAAKVNLICDALKVALEKVNKDNVYLLPILTTYIKRQPQELKQVLAKIKDMQAYEKEQGLQAKVVPPHLNASTMKKDVDPNAIKLGSKEALEFVSWLVNPNKLFDVAMTTYDFDLVTMVASQTQKDPKEYVPYLAMLKELPNASYQKYKIHLDLKEYERALEWLAKCSEDDSYFEEAKQLIRKQRLYKHALGCFEGQRLKQVNRLFGEYLEERGYIDEAAYAYITAGELQLSLNAFLKVLDVGMVFSVAAQLKIQDLRHIKNDLIERLQTASRFEEAGDLIDPKVDFDNCLQCYLRASAFDKAIQLCLKQDRADQIHSQVKPSATISFELKFNQLKHILDTYCKRLLRLRIVQNTKRTMPVTNLGGDFELDSEQLSVSNASQSDRSRSSQGGFSETSKKSRKQQNAANKMRKRRVVKEGSPFEEEYLLELIKEETCLQPRDKDHVKSLMKTLMFFGMIDQATLLHQLVDKVIKAHNESRKLLSVEQERILQEHPFVKDVFSEYVGFNQQRVDAQKRELQDWENQKSFKH